jgi:hypothetical protein
MGGRKFRILDLEIRIWGLSEKHCHPDPAKRGRDLQFPQFADRAELQIPRCARNDNS